MSVVVGEAVVGFVDCWSGGPPETAWRKDRL